MQERELAAAFVSFDPLWDVMTSQEQARLVQLLVQQVDYNGASGLVSVTFHSAGIKTLAAEVAAKKRA